MHLLAQIGSNVQEYKQIPVHHHQHNHRSTHNPGEGGAALREGDGGRHCLGPIFELFVRSRSRFTNF